LRRRSAYFSLIAACAILAGIVGCNLSDSQVALQKTSSGIGAVNLSGTPSAALLHAMQVQNKNSNKLFAVSGVVGTGSSVNEKGEAVVVVFTAGPGVKNVPAEVDGVPVVVEVTGPITANPGLSKVAATKPTVASAPACVIASTASRFTRPVPIGVSTSHTSVTAGTIGVRVKDKKGNLFLLSNNHVFANTNNAAAGDKILQPGVFDGGVNPADVIGTLSSFTPLVYCKGSACTANRMDAALVATTAALSGNATPCDGYGTPSSTVATPTANLKVKKFGRTTRLTSGVIAAVNVTVDVAYTATNIARFTGQVYIATPNFIGPGDSGALIVTETDNKPVALVFAGTSTMAFATPISEILTKFAVTIDGI
jgi:hypothetical protein